MKTLKLREVKKCESGSFWLQNHCSLLHLSYLYSGKISVMWRVLRSFFPFIWDSIQSSICSLAFHVNTVKTTHCEAQLSHTVTISSKISLVGVELSAFCEHGKPFREIKGQWHGVPCKSYHGGKEHARVFTAWREMSPDACNFEILTYIFCRRYLG